MLGRPDPSDPAFEEAARKAFLAGTVLEAPKPPPPAQSARKPAERPLETVGGRPASPIAAIRTRPAAQPGLAEQTLEPHDTRGDDRPTDDAFPDRGARKADPSWPDLLRTPSAVAPVADDFFDGLIRRTERDR
jgi:hypothetical protein